MLFDFIFGRRRGDTALVVSYTFPQLIGAVDLLEGEGALAPGERARFKTWLRVFVRFHERADPSPNNHRSWQAVFLVSAAHILRDPALLDRGVSHARGGFRWTVLGNGAMPLELARGEKAATYTLMNLEALCRVAHLAEMHGVRGVREMRSAWGGDLRDAVGFLVDFLEDPRRWDRWTFGRTLNGPAAPAGWAGRSSCRARGGRRTRGSRRSSARARTGPRPRAATRRASRRSPSPSDAIPGASVRSVAARRAVRGPPHGDPGRVA